MGDPAAVIPTSSHPIVQATESPVYRASPQTPATDTTLGRVYNLNKVFTSTYIFWCNLDSLYRENKFLYIYIYTSINSYVCMHACMFICMSVYIFIYSYICLYLHIFICLCYMYYICAHIYTYAWYILTFVYIERCAHTYTHARIHTDMYNVQIISALWHIVYIIHILDNCGNVLTDLNHNGVWRVRTAQLSIESSVPCISNI